MSEVQELFEQTSVYLNATKHGEITYTNLGGYLFNGEPYFYMNGCFAMFSELYDKSYRYYQDEDEPENIVSKAEDLDTLLDHHDENAVITVVKRVTVDLTTQKLLVSKYGTVVEEEEQ